MLKSGRTIKNNSGFTLLEVLIAMIILGIMAVPFARAFATAAQTNRKARIEAQCSNVAENIAEEFRNVKVSDLKAKYITDSGSANVFSAEEGIVVTDDSNPTINYKNQDRYTFEIRERSDLGDRLPDGYYATVTLDSSYYYNSNNLNLSHISPISIKDSAIYTMAEDMDKKAYRHFVQLNEDARGTEKDLSGYPDIRTNPDAYQAHNSVEEQVKEELELTWLRKNLYRTITINIKKGKGGSVTTGSGANQEVIDLVEVTMKIEYELKGYDGKYFPSGNEKYTMVDTYLFDNSVSNQKYRGVYLFFYPRYAAACLDKSKDRDKIVIENYDNIESNVYLVALSGASDGFDYKNSYESDPYGLKVDVYETGDGKIDGKDDLAITLRTNLCKEVPYASYDPLGNAVPDGSLLLDLDYWNPTTKYNPLSIDNADAMNYVNTQYVDGKALESDNAVKRIYKMVVSIYDDSPDVDELGNPIVKDPVVEFDGTKLEF